MKTRRWFNRNRLTSILRIVTVGTFLTAAAAIALFAASVADPVPDTGLVQTSFVPRSLSAEPMIVVAQLSGKSMAEAQADAGRKLTGSEKSQIKNQLKAIQDGLKPQIELAGGTVLAQFQSALN